MQNNQMKIPDGDQNFKQIGKREYIPENESKICTIKIRHTTGASS